MEEWICCEWKEAKLPRGKEKSWPFYVIFLNTQETDLTYCLPNIFMVDPVYFIHWIDLISRQRWVILFNYSYFVRHTCCFLSQCNCFISRGNLHYRTALSGIVEVPGDFFGIFLMSSFGRKNTVGVLLLRYRKYQFSCNHWSQASWA